MTDMISRNPEQALSSLIPDGTQWPASTMFPDGILRVMELKRYNSTTAFYSNPSLNQEIAKAEHIVFHILVNESSTSPTLTVVAEDSADGENWADVSTLLNAVSISATPSTYRATLSQPFARHVRLRFSLGGVTPWVVMSATATPRGRRDDESAA